MYVCVLLDVRSHIPVIWIGLKRFRDYCQHVICCRTGVPPPPLFDWVGLFSDVFGCETGPAKLKTIYRGEVRLVVAALCEVID